MIPIYEQGGGKSIGYMTETFARRFQELCHEHLQKGRARAFAFIFYNFYDEDFGRLLNDQGVFAQLDRLAGRELSVFYLHSGVEKTVERFNTHFLARLGLGETVMLPSIVFFKVEDDQIKDVRAMRLESADLIHGFHELYGVIQDYISNSLGTSQRESKYRQWIKTSAKFVGVEAFKALITAFLKGELNMPQ